MLLMSVRLTKFNLNLSKEICSTSKTFLGLPFMSLFVRSILVDNVLYLSLQCVQINTTGTYIYMNIFHTLVI